MNNRGDAYLAILHFGLLRIRELAHAGHVRECEVEAGHLHNAPSLVNETNEHRHKYYFDNERQAYLDAVDRSLANSEFVLKRYEESWEVLSAPNQRLSE